MIEIKTIITEDFTGVVRFEMISPASADATEKEKRIAARVRDSFNTILDDIADLAISDSNPHCPHCQSQNVQDVTNVHKHKDDGKKVYQCVQCCKYFGIPETPALPPPSKVIDV